MPCSSVISAVRVDNERKERDQGPRADECLLPTSAPSRIVEN